MFNLLSSNISAVANVVALVFILFFALYGFIRGFTRTFISIFGTILSMLFAILLCSSVVSFIESKFFAVSSMSNSLFGITESIFGKDLMNATLSEVAEGSLKDAGLSSFIVNLILSLKLDTSLPADTTLNQIICPIFSYYIWLIIAIIILFVIFNLIFFIIGQIVKDLHKIRFIGILDKSLGFLLGFISGIIYLELFIMILGALPINAIQSVYSEIQLAPVVSVLCAINPYDSIFNLISFDKISAFVVSFLK